jgi:uncharacterized protein (TIGR00297 family)
LLIQIILGFFIAFMIAFAAYRLHALNRSGAAAAVFLGTIFLGVGGIRMAILLVTFFISSSVLSRLFGQKKHALNEKFSKGSERDAAQVLANGGIAGFFLLVGLFFPSADWPWIASAAALAAANADTWATELGVLNPSPPVLITTRQPVERGTSGAISVSGTLAAAAGAGLIALLASLAPRPGMFLVANPLIFLDSASGYNLINMMLFIILTISGVAGSLFDSFLGASLQAIYYCPTCCKETEQHPFHNCDTRTSQLRGLFWLNNDLVNGGCTFSAALFAVLLLAIFNFT